ncbi:hypothetical protein JOE63_001313 [Cellulosimicrobium cellulans]|jgi:hypothetical protein|uniref:Cardiolipin synthase N-terminal domain-containing protein n=1 Tax=Cellulosimicrobium cellulans TaxID=1710 RepID=A0A1Y0HY57_CELCE|nr:PLD nuclease N-terminal domain-containing protein [Cellulosimicrobium cellulans]ARU52235.1 hypothetical protein CBR64_12975 [Cellulosimicrobium cellulans]MBM7818836.1 hypothetical protein [Cellulosimicrobium cellulans]
MLRVLLPLIAVGLAVYALVDLASSDEEERGGIPKGLWIVLIILLPFLGPIAWILVKRSAGRSGSRYAAGRPSGGSSNGGTRRRRNAPVAPDDDPEFLWRLEQQQRRQARDDAPSPATDDAPPAAGDTTEDGRTEDDGDAHRPGASNGSDDGDDTAR